MHPCAVLPPTEASRHFRAVSASGAIPPPPSAAATATQLSAWVSRREVVERPGPLRFRQVQAPPLSAADTERFEALLAPIGAELDWVSPVPRVVSAAWTPQPSTPTPGRRPDEVTAPGIDLAWYVSDYRVTLAIGRDLEKVPPARRHESMTVFTHLVCRQGEVVARRSQQVYSARGLYQPTAAEGVDVGDLLGGLDLFALASRSLAEEVGVELPLLSAVSVDVGAAVLSYVPALLAPTLSLHLVVQAPTLEFADVLTLWSGAPDGWESEALELRHLSANHPQVSGLWWPSSSAPLPSGSAPWANQQASEPSSGSGGLRVGLSVEVSPISGETCRLDQRRRGPGGVRVALDGDYQVPVPVPQPVDPGGVCRSRVPFLDEKVLTEVVVEHGQHLHPTLGRLGSEHHGVTVGDQFTHGS